MEIVVCVKRVPATDSKIKVGSDGKSVDPAGVDTGGLGRSVVLVLLGRMVGSGAASVEHGPGAAVWRWL